MSIRNIAWTHFTASDYHWLTCDKINMHRIIMRLATRGDDYVLMRNEDIFTIVVSSHVDLGMMRTKLKGIEFDFVSIN